MPHILITGGAGFIGSALVRYLIQQTDAQVTCYDKLTYAGRRESLRDVIDSPRLHFIEADVCDATAVRDALDHAQPDAVLHLAAETHVDRSIDGPGAFVQTNLVGTATLLEAARDYWPSLPHDRHDAFRFVHVSTDEVFGSLDEGGAFSEASPYDPQSPYAATKAGADHLARAWYHTYGLPVVVTNCSNNFGPYQFPEKLIPLMIVTALHREPLPVYGDGQQVRDWLFVDDHAAALWQVAQQGKAGQTYVVGARCERTNLQVVQQICATLDRFAPHDDGPYADLITHVDDRPGHDQRYAIDPGKLERELNWSAHTPFDQALEQTVRWYLDNQWWWRPIRERTYAGQRLGTAHRDQGGAT
jgi:dTDP-glucose 4,6-dehydratase